jgi:hypothetical protein
MAPRVARASQRPQFRKVPICDKYVHGLSETLLLTYLHRRTVHECDPEGHERLIALCCQPMKGGGAQHAAFTRQHAAGNTGVMLDDCMSRLRTLTSALACANPPPESHKINSAYAHPCTQVRKCTLRCQKLYASYKERSSNPQKTTVAAAHVAAAIGVRLLTLSS